MSTLIRVSTPYVGSPPTTGLATTSLVPQPGSTVMVAPESPAASRTGAAAVRAASSVGAGGGDGGVVSGPPQATFSPGAGDGQGAIGSEGAELADAEPGVSGAMVAGAAVATPVDPPP